ncbi:MAG: hypothetical protein R6U58_01700 [Bacteroidales bacterium]
MRLITVFSVVIMSAYGCSMPVALVAPGQDDPVALKEDVKDGLPDRMKQDENTGFHYGFEYDRNNLYLKLAVSDPAVKRKIVYFGFTVWIDRNGQKNKVEGFRFPTGLRMPQARRSEGRNPGSAGGIMGGDMNSVLEMAEEIELIGIYGTSARTVKMRDSRIRVNAEIVDDLLVYEAVIPYEVLEFGYNPLSGNTPVSIGLETGYFEPPSSSERQRPERSGRGVRNPGGMPGQYPGQYQGRMPEMTRIEPRSADMVRLSKPTRLWILLEFLK